MTNTLEKTTAVTEETNEGLVKFANPYTFEGKTYNEIDLSGVENLTTAELIEAEDLLAKTGKMVMVPEISFPYLMVIAAKATNQPQEFFNSLPGTEGIKVKRKVANFLNSAE